MKKIASVLCGLIIAFVLAGCATAERYAGLYGLGGGILGAGIGAAGGLLYGNPAKGAFIGGLSGAAAGGYYGYQRGLTVEQEQAIALQQRAAAAPAERCSWSYDHAGTYAYRCDGSVVRSHPGPPQVVLPPPAALTPAVPPAPATVAAPPRI